MQQCSLAADTEGDELDQSTAVHATSLISNIQTTFFYQKCKESCQPAEEAGVALNMQSELAEGAEFMCVRSNASKCRGVTVHCALISKRRRQIKKPAEHRNVDCV